MTIELVLSATAVGVQRMNIVVTSRSSRLSCFLPSDIAARGKKDIQVQVGFHA